MNPEFPLSDIIPRRVETVRKVAEPRYADDFWQISPHEFAMQVEGVGSFYACNGNEVEYAPAPDASKASVELYLNGSVYGAILHQQQILPLHGSSFAWNGRGILLCGESGAGKSSLTVAFCRMGAHFLTDDVTPVVFENKRPLIRPRSDRLKLWEDSLQQLEYGKENLSPVSNRHDKYYFPVKKSNLRSFPLDMVLTIEPADIEGVETTPLEGIGSFTVLRNEVYRWEYLAAMPETEALYLEQLLAISRSARVTKVRRPAGIRIAEMAEFLKTLIG